MTRRKKNNDIDLLTYWRKDVGQFTLQDDADLAALVEAAKAGDDQARERMITPLLPLCERWAQRFPRVDRIEAVGVANLAVVEAVDSLLRSATPPRQWAQLCAYCAEAVRRELIRASARTLTSTSIGESALMESGGRHPIRLPDRQLSETIEFDDDEAELSELIADPNAKNPEHEAALKEGREIILNLLEQHLTSKQFMAMVLTFGLTGEEPLESPEAGEAMGISGASVLYHVQAAIKKLKQQPDLQPLLRSLTEPPRCYGKAYGWIPAGKGPTTTTSKMRSNQRISPEQGAEIRKRREAGEQLKPLAKEFGVSEMAISRWTRKKG